MPADPSGNSADAKAAGLHYVRDGEPGLARVTRGRKFACLDAGGRTIRDAPTLDRIRSLVIPPAWTDVWICARADGHLQATGRDARRRKQHRYHPDWTSARTRAKYDTMIAFASALPEIRTRVRADLKKTPLSRAHVLATVVTLLDKTLIRIGNREYARANRSYGLTTMLDQHVEVKGSAVTFRFRAKSGVMQAIELDDAPVAQIVTQCRALPGKALFQYLDSEGRRQCVDSAAVNAYLGEVTRQRFTAKNFRTWAASVLAAAAVCDLPLCTSDAAFKRNVLGAIDSVAARLGNTRAVCRKSYIHPTVLEAYRDGQTIGTGRGPGHAHFSAKEAAVLALLKRSRKHGEKAAA